MKKAIILPVLFLAFSLVINAQNKKQLDQEAIKSMCGCFEVTFNFTETFSYSKDSVYQPSEKKIDYALEWAQLVQDEDNKVSIQHLLQVGKPDNPYIVKHWRQDWLFENTNLYMYNGDNNWDFEKRSNDAVTGQWTQKVFQVDDSPRYEGSATWVHVDGKSYWENTTPAPLPRREYTKRNDYNITLRGNRQEITKGGWVHDQDNAKIVRADGQVDVIIADEKGHNTYKKVDDSTCQGAIDWWQEHQDKWAMVRAKWNEVYGRHQNLVLEEKVDNKVLYKFLFDNEMTKESDINSTIESFVKK
ncbi:hypothetical protein ES692_11170 [Psychroserpens burtonensis]|uniref:Uncharacterized protein n=1 Tax=Psychroserpens burtonensis TaxID=49278 RepID=A0A5C7B7F7_9FLAO|nr:DUF6607 family protein [Psychroserpens burtonensis]TXE16906.1 hypothetical protein ES692_11170 [Psychroserpens burtonensis]